MDGRRKHARSRLAECNESGVGRGEAARVEVEPPEVIVEVDVHPFASRDAGLIDGEFDELRSDPVSSNPGRHHRVQDEGMSRAVPRHVDEPGEVVIVAGSHPPKAVSLNLCFPVVIEGPMVEALGVQPIDLFVLEITPPLVSQRHGRRR